MNEDEIRALIDQAITEHTMPKEWSAPDPEWLIPYRVYARDYGDTLDKWVRDLYELKKEVVRLRAKIGEHIP